MTIKEAINRIRRIGSGRGFGIQSPSDYGFVCDIVNCRYPYYAYAELKKRFPCISKKERKKAELLFRLANFVQPAVTVNLGAEAWYEAYVKSGCRKTKICNAGDTGIADEVEGGRGLLLILPCAAIEHVGGIDVIWKYMNDGTYLMADGINDNKKAQAIWKRIVADKRSTLAFDLYDAGIVAVNSKRTKVMYKINY